MIYVISTNDAKKVISKYFKDKGHSVKVSTFKEYVAFRNSKVKLKKDKRSEELISMEFDTLYKSHKNEIGLCDCILIESEDDILEILQEQYELIEIK